MRRGTALALIVEDDPEWMDALTEYVAIYGFDVVQARTLQCAIDQAMHQYALVISDLKLETHSEAGLEVLESARQASPNTVLMLVTSHGDQNVRRKVEALGAEYVPKQDATQKRFHAILERLLGEAASVPADGTQRPLVQRKLLQFLAEVAGDSSNGLLVAG
jgi:DNA-binding response OmpR family regulator